MRSMFNPTDFPLHDNAATRTQGQSQLRKPSLMSKSFADDRCKLWDHLLAAQVAVFSNAEVSHLAELTQWCTSNSIADIGCGNGDYIAELSRQFPNKIYNGIDLSPELIAIAEQNHSDENLKFECRDIACDQNAPRVDFIILRFVVQHLDHPGSFFRSVKQLLHPTGCLIVIEPNLKASGAYPDLAEFHKLVNGYDTLAHAVGASRSQTQDLTRLAQLFGDDWTVVRADSIVSSHERKTWNEVALRQVFVGWIDAIQATNRLDWDYGSVRSEVENWITYKGDRIDFVLSATMLRPDNTD